MIDWQMGKPVLGYDSHPAPWVYVSTDRSLEGVERQLNRMHIPLSTFPYVSTVGLADDVRDHIKAGSDKCPGAKVFVIEGMSGLPQLKEKSQDGGYGTVRRWLGRLTNYCQDSDITIIGIVHSPKMKADSRYMDPRQRVMGSVAWGAYSETIFLIEAANEDKPDSHRTLLCLPRNTASITQELMFNECGRLVEADLDIENALVAEWLSKLPLSTTFETNQFVDAMMKQGLSKRSAERHLATLVHEGHVVKSGKGLYKRPNPS